MSDEDFKKAYEADAKNTVVQSWDEYRKRAMELDKEWTTSVIFQSTGRLNPKARPAVVEKLKKLGEILVAESAKKIRAEDVNERKLREYAKIIVDLKTKDTGDGSTIGATIDQMELVVKDAVAKKK